MPIERRKDGSLGVGEGEFRSRVGDAQEGSRDVGKELWVEEVDGSTEGDSGWVENFETRNEGFEGS